VRRPLLRSLASLVGALIFVSPIACRPGQPVAPSWSGRGAVGERELPLATAHYVFSRPGSAARAELAGPLADRFLQRAQVLLSQGRERHGLSSVRIAAMLVRTHRVPPAGLSDAAVAALDAAVTGPAARGDEGASLGLYQFWSSARPADPRPKGHLDALAKWTGAPADLPLSPLVSVGREAVRRADALAYAPTDAGRPDADRALVDWMEQVNAFKDGERTPARYGDEVYAAVLGYRTSGVRLLGNHLRDGDLGGAIEAMSNPRVHDFVPEALRRVLLDAGAAPGPESYEQIIAALRPATKLEGLEDLVGDAIFGLALLGTGENPRAASVAEFVARGVVLAGSGDAAPAILAHALLGTRDDPRRPPAKDLGRALSIAAAAIRDYADREDYEAARRTFVATAPLLDAAGTIGGVQPSGAMVRTLMGLVEGDAGRPTDARRLFDEAIAAEPLATAWAGRAQLEARAGNVGAARASIVQALGQQGAESEPVLQSDLLILAGDLARRAGDVPGARDFYERALKLLAPLRSSAKGATAAEVGARIVAVLVRFDGGLDREDDAAALAESAAPADPKPVARMILTRFLRPLRQVDAPRARRLARRTIDLGLPPEHQVRAAILARAIGKRAGAAPDAELARLLGAAAARDDAAGRLAKVALGQLDPQVAIGKAEVARRVWSIRFATAIGKWADGGAAAAKDDLEAIAQADVASAIEADLAREILEPGRGAIPGPPPKVTGI
jgi:tetratricopeptide (TPR) repeat protein